MLFFEFEFIYTQVMNERSNISGADGASLRKISSFG